MVAVHENQQQQFQNETELYNTIQVQAFDTFLTDSIPRRVKNQYKVKKHIA